MIEYIQVFKDLLHLIKRKCQPFVATDYARVSYDFYDVVEKICEEINHCLHTIMGRAENIEQQLVEMQMPIPMGKWCHEDGAVLWWCFPIQEAPYCGTPDDTDFPTMSGERYHTHFTRIILPARPEA